MGLDWNPMARPRPGHETEVSELLGRSLDALSEQERATTLNRFREITEAPFETLGAPRVGRDNEANAWLLDRLREQSREAEYSDAVRSMDGYYVLDLLPESPGLPVYTSWGYEGVDRYTFRGKFLDVVKELIGDDLYERAWNTMASRELLDYGNAILQAARAYAALHHLQHLEHQREPPDSDDEEAPAVRAHIMFSAAQWCIWWAERGHGLEPYF